MAETKEEEPCSESVAMRTPYAHNEPLPFATGSTGFDLAASDEEIFRIPGFA